MFVSTAERGQSVLYITASPDIAEVSVSEQTGELGRLRLDPREDGLNGGFYYDPWRCDRRARAFTVTGTGSDGVSESASYSVRTPSCRTRFALTAPARARQGARVGLDISDTWAGAAVGMRLCVRPPAGRERCRPTGPGRSFVRLDRRGRWRVTIHGPDQRIAHAIAVGVPVRDSDKLSGSGIPVLVTGDSMMQSVDAVLGDRLAGRAGVISEIQIATGLGRPGFSWAELASQQVARYSPAATVLMVGVNDYYALQTPGGGEVECCDEGWIAEYARRASEVMRIYAQGGAGEVTWLTIPAARQDDRTRVFDAINVALERAAAENPDVFLLPADEVLTPGGVYRDDMEVDGRRVRVREDDGIHVAIPGARVLATEIIRRLRTIGLIRERDSVDPSGS